MQTWASKTTCFCKDTGTSEFGPHPQCKAYCILLRLGDLFSRIVRGCMKTPQASFGRSSPTPLREVRRQLVELGKRNHTPPAPVRNYSLPQDMGARKISLVNVVSPVFIGFLYLRPAWKGLIRDQKVIQTIFFRWRWCTLLSSFS